MFLLSPSFLVIQEVCLTADYNNAACAAEHLARHSAAGGGSGRVAVVDIDYHHGNGTQQIFWER